MLIAITQEYKTQTCKYLPCILYTYICVYCVGRRPLHVSSHVSCALQPRKMAHSYYSEPHTAPSTKKERKEKRPLVPY